MRRAAKRDRNEAEIVEALRKCGLHVIHADQPWDLVCSWGGYVKLAEVKAPRNMKMEPERFSAAQQHILETWQGEIDVLVTTKQAAEFAERLKSEARLLNAARAMGRAA
jgi:hypothetical protein